MERQAVPPGARERYFLSHSEEDEWIAILVAKIMHRHGIPFWLDGLYGKDPNGVGILQAVEKCECIVVISSRSYDRREMEFHDARHYQGIPVYNKRIECLRLERNDDGEPFYEDLPGTHVPMDRPVNVQEAINDFFSKFVKSNLTPTEILQLPKWIDELHGMQKLGEPWAIKQVLDAIGLEAVPPEPFSSRPQQIRGVTLRSTQSSDTSVVSWSPLPTPSTRHCYCGSASWGNNKFILVGGLEDVRDPTSALASVEVYTFGVGRWETLPELRVPRYHTTAIVLNDVLFVFGGTGSDGLPLGSCERLELSAANSTFAILDSRLPRKRRNMGAATDGENIYLFGGDSSPASDESFSFHPQSSRFTQLPSMENGRSRPVAATLNDTVLVTGGVDQNGGLQSSVESYDIPTGTWTPRVSPPATPDSCDEVICAYVVEPNDLVVVTRSHIKTFRIKECLFTGETKLSTRGRVASNVGQRVVAVQEDGTVEQLDAIRWHRQHLTQPSTSESRGVESTLYTSHINSEGVEEHVGELHVDGVNPSRAYAVSPNSYVFLCHYGKETKEELARPTYWFLSDVMGVDAFFDNSSMVPSDGLMRSLLEAAHKCTHAVVILSPSFRKSRYCVMELNTFATRHQRREVHVATALWNVGDTLRVYAKAIQQLNWLHSRTGTMEPGEYLVDTLWPYLLDQVGSIRRGSSSLVSRSELCGLLVRYVEEHRGKNRFAIPPSLERFVAQNGGNARDAG